MAAELAAASSGSVASGGLTMIAFGLGTLPLLFAFGTASSLIPGTWRKRLTFVLAFVVIAMGLVFLNRTAMILGFPVNARTVQTAVLGTKAPAAAGAQPSYTTGADGVVEVRLAWRTPASRPPTSRFPPTGRCASSSIDRMRILFETTPDPRRRNQPRPCDNGTTTIDLPATNAGTFTMTCGMGMMSGRLLVGGGGGGRPVPPWAWLVVSAVAVAWRLGRDPRQARSATRHRRSLFRPRPGLRRHRHSPPTITPREPFLLAYEKEGSATMTTMRIATTGMHCPPVQC